ncbi:MAG: glycosyltransferase [Elusimicrobiaceae bacterium]|nr:glycosyltransferase [Elusimicrobiaceae bacterium]
MSSPLISIIVPIYNVEKYLSQCLDSIVAQTYQNLEIILVDDGSPDNCGKICDEYAAKDSRIKIIHQVNAGLSAARNAGLEIAMGEYIGFVDSDDYIESDMYEYLYGLIKRDNAAMAMCAICQDEGFVDDRQCKFPYLLIPTLEIFQFSNWPPVWNKLYRRDFISTLRFNTTVSNGEDGLFIFELSKSNVSIALGNQAKYHYCCNRNPTSLTKTFQRSHLNRIVLEEQCLEYAKQHNLMIYYKVRSRVLLVNAAKWLHQIALSDVPDQYSIKFLTKYIKQHFMCFLLTNTIHKKAKLFALVACVNFNLARKIYLSLRKLRGRE